VGKKKRTPRTNNKPLKNAQSSVVSRPLELHVVTPLTLSGNTDSTQVSVNCNSLELVSVEKLDLP